MMYAKCNRFVHATCYICNLDTALINFSKKSALITFLSGDSFISLVFVI